MVQEIKAYPVTTTYGTRGKVSDGKSVEVTVPQNTTIEAHKFYLLDGFLGMAMEDVTTGAGETSKVALSIEPAEYETDQIDVADAFNAGDKVYWDSANSRFTTVATDSFFAGIVTKAKDANNVVWLWFAPQQPAFEQGVAVADITTDMSADANDNELKNKINELLAALRAANLIAT